MRTALLFFVAATICAGCADDPAGLSTPDSQFAPGAVGADIGDAGVHMVPFKGVGIGKILSQTTHPDCEGGYKLHSAGEGEATHLGRYSVDLVYCQIPDPETGGFRFTDGVGTYEAANGDSLFVVWESVPPHVELVGDLVYLYVHQEVTGGTGRLAGAGGWIGAVAQQRWIPWSAEFAMDLNGMISNGESL